MNWKMLLCLVPVGGLMGAAMVLGLDAPFDMVLWMVICPTVGFLLARHSPHRAGRQALLLGFTWGLLHNLVESIFFDPYLAHHPGLELLIVQPDSLPFPDFLLAISPAVGLVIGLILRLFTWIFQHLPAEQGSPAEAPCL